MKKIRHRVHGLITPIRFLGLLGILTAFVLLVSAFKEHPQKVVTVDQSSVEIGVSALSPAGESGGALFPASCPSWQHLPSEPEYDGECGADPAEPTGLSASCPSPGTLVTYSWNAVSDASFYRFRSDFNPFSWNNGCNGAQNPGDACHNQTGTSFSSSASPGNRYDWWVYACNANGCSDDAVGSRVTCVAPPSYTLSVSKSGTGSGRVTSSPVGINCGTDCTQSYVSGTNVTLTPTPSSNSTFTGWTGACTGTGGCAVSMTAARSVGARFVLKSYTLTVTKSGTGSGRVTSSPVGINCGTDCTQSYVSGTNVTLTPTPSSNSTFTGWTGACTGTGGCAVSMTAARSVGARFVLKSYTLTVTKSGTGSGRVTSTPSGITCGTDCTQSYPHGTSVTLTQSPTGGSTFVRWTGSCTGTGGCAVSMTAARGVNAEFRNRPPIAEAVAVSVTDGNPTGQTFPRTSVTIQDGYSIRLSGEGSSDPEGSSLTYNWSCTGGTLSSATSNRPSWTATAQGSFTCALQVNDGVQNSPSDSVAITVTGPPPVVNLSADDPIISYNTGTTLRWTVTWSVSSPGDACTASEDWSGSKNINAGSEPTGNLIASSTYVLTCVSPIAGTGRDEIEVKVRPRQPGFKEIAP